MRERALRRRALKKKRGLTIPRIPGMRLKLERFELSVIKLCAESGGYRHRDSRARCPMLLATACSITTLGHALPGLPQGPGGVFLLGLLFCQSLRAHKGGRKRRSTMRSSTCLEQTSSWAKILSRSCQCAQPNIPKKWKLEAASRHGYVDVGTTES